MDNLLLKREPVLDRLKCPQELWIWPQISRGILPGHLCVVDLQEYTVVALPCSCRRHFG
jgi:hypothetical protein